MIEIRVGVLGRIETEEEIGRVVEVIDDTGKTGGYLIFTYADANRSPEAFDSWVESLMRGFDSCLLHFPR